MVFHQAVDSQEPSDQSKKGPLRVHDFTGRGSRTCRAGKLQGFVGANRTAVPSDGRDDAKNGPPEYLADI